MTDPGSEPAQPTARPPAAFYVTFSGEKDKGGSKPINNVVSLDRDGQIISRKVLRHLPADVQLHILRGMAFGADGTLYVANAHRTHSMILAFGPPNEKGHRAMLGVEPFAHHDRDGLALVHPYGVVFDRDHRLLVSVQDTAVVTRFEPDRRTAPIAHYLRSFFEHIPFLPGTLVAGSLDDEDLPEAIPSDQGGLTTPRGIAYDQVSHHVYVADEFTRSVRCYDADTGAFLGDAVQLKHKHGRPIGVHLAGRRLYVGTKGGNHVFVYDLDQETLEKVIDGNDDQRTIGHPSGIARGADGALYVASIEDMCIVRRDPVTGELAQFGDVFTDCPEHIISVPPEFAVPVAQP
jgi:sugar lactone lactonase YvrE